MSPRTTNQPVRRRLGLFSLALAAAMLGGAQSGFGQVRPRQDTVRRLSPATSTTSQVRSAQDAAVANALAAALQKVGVNVDQANLAAITQAITAGGSSAMALAGFMTTAIADITNATNPSASTSSGPQDPTGLTQTQRDQLLQRLTQRQDTTLALSRYLRGKLTQVRTVRGRG